MKTSVFEYKLPPDLIAQEPAPTREGARMLVIHREHNAWEHRNVRDLPEYLQPGDIMVVNDTRVIAARLFGKKPTGGKVELLFLEQTDADHWDALLRCSRRPAVGSWIEIGSGQARAQILADGKMGRVSLRIESDRPLLDILEEEGSPPLPPYINRDYTQGAQLASDRERYQTVFARKPGAVAAPTAGLHFSQALLDKLDHKGIERTAITLHVGPGTFRPVSADRVEDHHMDDERYAVPAEAATRIEEAKGAGRRLIAVGSTSVRTLESVAAEHGHVVPCEGRTELFIHPPYTFRIVDTLLTNFHLPRSTLLMMVCAFGGQDLIMSAYEEAVRKRYRFYSYGDCMLVV